MKRILIIASIIVVLLTLYGIETKNSFGFNQYKPIVNIADNQDEYILSWNRTPYPVYYEVEILNRVSENSAVPAHRIVNYRTLDNNIKINKNLPESAYVRISAHSIFAHPLGYYSDSIPISLLKLATNNIDIKPAINTHFSADNPAPNIPTLTWTVVPGAVYYEIEFLNDIPENPNDIHPSRYQIFSSKEVYTNGYSVNLTNFPSNHLYYRVRALNYSGKAIGVFSNAEELYINHAKNQVLKPLHNTGYRAAGVPIPLYPVYSWIPISGAAAYEVEVTTAPPENPNDTKPSRYSLRKILVQSGSDCYDEEPLITAGTYYWRVRGLDANGNAVGVYSDAEMFIVDLSAGSYSATFGDSITHGGGAISYSPADVEYSYQTYLSFPTANLGKSGDTSETMLNRFNQDVLPYHPKFLIIMGGSNSLRGGIPASQVIKELSGIRDKCLANNIRPIFLTLPPINPDAIYQAFNEETSPDWQKNFSLVNKFIRQQRYYIDLEPYFIDDSNQLPPYYATDGLHLDIEGKKLMAQIINANWSRVTH